MPCGGRSTCNELWEYLQPLFSRCPLGPSGAGEGVLPGGTSTGKRMSRQTVFAPCCEGKLRPGSRRLGKMGPKEQLQLAVGGR